jgi:hypothetical protein
VFDEGIWDVSLFCAYTPVAKSALTAKTTGRMTDFLDGMVFFL